LFSLMENSLAKQNRQNEPKTCHSGGLSCEASG